MLFLLLSIAFAQNNSLLNITQKLGQKRYIGEWNSEPNAFNFLDGVKGESKMGFMINGTTKEIYGLYMLYLDPRYFDEKIVETMLLIDGYNETEQYLQYLRRMWNGTSALNYSDYRKLQVLDEKLDCQVKYLLTIQFDQSLPKIHLEMNSTDCNINLFTTYEIDDTNYQGQVQLYCLLMNTICLIQFMCVNRLCIKFMTTHFHDVSRISIYTVAYVTVYDTYLCFQNFAYAVQNYIFFQYFIITTFLYLMLSITGDLKLLWILWRCKFEEQLADPNQERKYFARFFIIFYTSIVVFYILMKNFELYNYFILATSLFMVPQIWHNISRGQNPKFMVEYIFGILLVNIAPPVSLLSIQLYFRVDSDNFRGLAPSIWFSICWVLSFTFQIGFLFLQSKFGPRFIIPKCFLPKQYNYFQKLSVNEDCAICLDTLLHEPDEKETELQSVLINKEIMVTPCNHKFHITCLQNWMDVKLSCPSCRKTIPPII